MPSSAANHDAEPRRRSLAELAERIGHPFSDLELLERALCHSSMGNAGKANYERLEFLGDSILGFIVADHLYRSKPEIPEGELTDRRSRIVSRQPLARVARALDLPTYLEAGRGLRDEDLKSPRIRADLVEAVLGAVYIDGGVRAARKFVRRHILAPLPARTATMAPARDPKSRLLHFAQVHGLGQPTYRVVGSEGPDHERVFTVVVAVEGEDTADGVARSKQAAEMHAAEQALARLQQRHAAGGPDAPSTEQDPAE